MSTATSSKTHTKIVTLALLGLSAAAGLGYWGYQNWEAFKSEYYSKGYSTELKQPTQIREESAPAPSVPELNLAP